MRYFESEFVVNKEQAAKLVKEFFASFNPRNVMKLDGQSAKVKIFFEDAHQCGIVDVIGEASEIQKFTYNGDDEVQATPLKHEGKEVQEEVQKEIQKEVTIEPKTAEPSEVKKSSKRSKRKSKAKKHSTNAKDSNEPGIYKSTSQRFYPWIDKFAQDRSGEEFFKDIGHELGFAEGTSEWKEYAEAIKIALRMTEHQTFVNFVKKLGFNERDKLLSFRRKINDSLEKRYPDTTLKATVIISRVVHYLNEKNFSFDESKTQSDKIAEKNAESDTSEADQKNDNTSEPVSNESDLKEDHVVPEEKKAKELLPSLQKSEKINQILNSQYDTLEQFIYALVSAMMIDKPENAKKEMSRALNVIVADTKQKKTLDDVARELGGESKMGIELQMKIAKMVNDYQKANGSDKLVKTVSFLNELRGAWIELKK